MELVHTRIRVLAYINYKQEERLQTGHTAIHNFKRFKD